MGLLKRWLEDLSVEMGFGGEINDDVIGFGQLRLSRRPTVTATISDLQAAAMSFVDSQERREARDRLVALRERCDACHLKIRGSGHWDGQHHRRGAKEKP